MVIRYESVSPPRTHATPNCHASKLITVPARDSFIIANTADNPLHHSEEPVNRWRGTSQPIGALLLSVSLSVRAGPYHFTAPDPTPPRYQGPVKGWVIRYPYASLYGLVTHFIGSNTLVPYDSRLFRRESVRVSPCTSITYPCLFTQIRADKCHIEATISPCIRLVFPVMSVVAVENPDGLARARHRTIESGVVTGCSSARGQVAPNCEESNA